MKKSWDVLLRKNFIEGEKKKRSDIIEAGGISQYQRVLNQSLGGEDEIQKDRNNTLLISARCGRDRRKKS